MRDDVLFIGWDIIDIINHMIFTKKYMCFWSTHVFALFAVVAILYHLERLGSSSDREKWQECLSMMRRGGSM